MPAKSENFKIPPFLACGLLEPCGPAKLAEASSAAPIASIASETAKRLRILRLPFGCQGALAYLLTSTAEIWLAARARVDRVPYPVAQEIERESRREDRKPRPDHQPRLSRVVGGPSRKQVAPAGIFGIDAEAEEREARLEQDVRGHRQRRVDDDRSNEVRNDVRAHDAAVARADHARRLDELLLPQREHLGAQDPGRVVPAEDGEHEHERYHSRSEDAECDRVETWADRRAEGDDEEQGREHHRQLDDTRDGGVDKAPVVAGDRSEDDSENHHGDRREDCNL